jgi:hypothetical protein
MKKIWEMLYLYFMTRQMCNVCCKKTTRIFKCKDCGSIICLECGKFYNDNNYCLYCESDIANVRYTEVYYYKNF